MATFTTFDAAALARYLAMFRIGDLHAFTPIPEGIENSNYFVSTNLNEEITEYVLSIIENHDFDTIPFFNSVMRHLSYYGLPVPAPKQTLDGMTSTIFCGKPTLLFPKLAGSHIRDVTSEHCHAIGNALGQMHVTLATEDFRRDNPYSPDWMQATVEAIASDINHDHLVLLRRITSQYEIAQELDLPKGIIHGDLFRDNVLFDQGELSGILDFFHACHDFLVQDVAITINDWCRNETGVIAPGHRDALLSGYSGARPLTEIELDHLTLFQTFSAARFSLTRLLSGKPGAYLKDPDEFIKLTKWLDDGNP